MPVAVASLAPFVPSEFERMLYWIRERESIRKLKEAGAPKPWTADPLLRDYRWCNVSRMDDRVSVELFRDWYCDGSPQMQLVAAALGRLVNWPESLLEATGGKPFRLEHLGGMRSALHARTNRGCKVWTGAYVIPGTPGFNKVDSIMDLIERIAANANTTLMSSLRLTWEALIQQKGLGSFLAGQIAADLAQLSCGERWPDRFSWAPVGPGSARGMNRLRGRPKNQALPQVQFDRELADFTEVLEPLIPEIFADRRLCAQDLQSVCCETDKYSRLIAREGTVRARYDGAGITASPMQASLL